MESIKGAKAPLIEDLYARENFRWWLLRPHREPTCPRWLIRC